MSDKKYPSDGLFTIVCESCQNVFAAEDRKCSCGQTKGQLRLDVDKMLNRIYDLHANDEHDAAMDVAFDTFWNLYNKYDLMNEILEKTDVSKLDGGLLVGFMMHTFKYSKQVPAHLDFCDRVSLRMKEMNYSDKRIHDLVDRYRGVGDYWQKMSEYGTPEWLSGPKPDDSIKNDHKLDNISEISLKEVIKEVISDLLIAPDSQLDAHMKPFIEKWSDPPSSLQILEVLDYCIHDALASTFVIKLFQVMYDEARKRENISHEEVIKSAVWREKF